MQSNSAFGDPGSVPREPRFTRDFKSEIAERAPDFCESLDEALYQQLAWVAQAIGADTGPAAHVVCNQAVNDLLDLAYALQQGAGRSAMRAARSLVEHAINLRTVLESPTEAQRYVDHLEQGAALLLEMAPGAELLRGSERKAYQHTLEKTGRAATNKFERAVEQYGPGFRRGWSSMNLRDRATRHGLANLYTFYRLASLVAHGSAGGVLGTRRSQGDGWVTHRTGPALELAPIAMWGGLNAYRSMLDAVESKQSDLRAAGWSAGLDTLEATWPSYYRALAALDADLWPEGPGDMPMAVFTYTQTGKHRWYLHLPQMGVFIEAHPPTLNEAQQSNVDHLLDQAADNSAFSPTQRWLTAAFIGAVVTPKDGGAIVPDTALLAIAPDGWHFEPVERD